MTAPARATNLRLSRLARRAMTAAASAAADGGRSVPAGSQIAVALLIGGALESPEFTALLASRDTDVGEIADRLAALSVVPEADPDLEHRRYRAFVASVVSGGVADCLDLIAALIASPYLVDEARDLLVESGVTALLAPSPTPDVIDGARALVGPSDVVGRRTAIDSIAVAISGREDLLVVGPTGVGKEAVVAAALRGTSRRGFLVEAPELERLTPAARAARLSAIARAIAPDGTLVIARADESATTIGVPPALPIILLSTAPPTVRLHPVRRAAKRVVLRPLPASRAVVAIADWAAHAGIDLEEHQARLVVDVAAGVPGALPGSAIGLLRAALELTGGAEAIDRAALEIAAAERGGLPIAIVSPAERERVRSFEAAIAARVIGQPEAVAAVGAVYRRRAIDLDLRSGPTAFLFSGPTGVGKTEIAKAIAEVSHGDAHALLRLDMGEFQHDHEIARLVGAPQGYVGYGDPGQLTTFLKEHPRSVLLFDEIEKAHPAMVRLLIGLIDAGTIHTGKGEAVSAKETTVILTSNIGGAGGRSRAGLGFGDRPAETDRARAASVERAVEGYFPPEFRNRLDAVIPFRAIDAAAMAAIIDLRLARLRERISRWQVTLEIAPALRQTIIEEAITSGFGGRELARRFDALVADRVVAAFIAGDYRAGATYRLERDPAEGSRIVRSTARRA